MAAQDVILSVRLSAQVGTKTLFSLKSDGAVDWYQGLTGFGTERGKGNRQNVFHYQATINAEEFVSSIEEELNGFVALEGTAFTIPSDKTCGAIETVRTTFFFFSCSLIVSRFFPFHLRFLFLLFSFRFIVYFFFSLSCFSCYFIRSL